jgi:hypothetical protein
LKSNRTVPEFPTKPEPRSSKQNPKLRINGKVNIFVDVYYRFLYEYKPEGKPFIDGTPTEVANMIVNNFTSRDGKDLSLNTVLTMLSPGKLLSYTAFILLIIF